MGKKNLVLARFIGTMIWSSSDVFWSDSIANFGFLLFLPVWLFTRPKLCRSSRGQVARVVFFSMQRTDFVQEEWSRCVAGVWRGGRTHMNGQNALEKKNHQTAGCECITDSCIRWLMAKRRTGECVDRQGALCRKCVSVCVCVCVCQQPTKSSFFIALQPKGGDRIC